jgi:triacylglycerol lipase
MTTAKLLQAVVAAAGVSALLWCGWCWRQGLGPGWWALGLLLTLAPQAPVLALEFVLLAVLGRDPAVPRPSAIQLLRAWWGEVLAAWQVFGWRQPFAADREPDVPGQLGRTGVLLLHGYVCNRGLWTPWLRQLRAAGVPCTAITMNPPFGSIDSYQPAIDAAVQDLTRRTGRPPLLVGHSMGGLSARAWLAGQPDAAAADARVAGMVTIATPHQGIWAARLGLSTNARQMRLGSRWLVALAAQESAARRARFTCFYGHADNLVFPASQAMLAGADNRHLAGVAHVAMVFEPAVLAEVLRRVNAQVAAPVDAKTRG